MIRPEVVTSLSGLIVVVSEPLSFGEKEDFGRWRGPECEYEVLCEVGWGGV